MWPRAVLVPVAWAAVQTRGTILGATYRRWSKRLGQEGAPVAVGHKTLVIIPKGLERNKHYDLPCDPDDSGLIV